MKRIFVKAGLASLSVAKKIVLGNAVAAGLTAGTHYFMVVSVNNAGTSVDSVTVDGVCK